MTQVAIPGGISLEYDAFGDQADPAVLLVMGFGAQLIAWPDEFCAMLAAGGRFVVRYDNRDCGLSTKMDGTPDLGAIIEAASAGHFDRARALVPYTLSDMADDGLALLTALGIDRAHVVGASMGGMTAQTMAIEHPERVLTLTSMMASTGEPEFGQSTPEALQVLMTPAPSDRDGYIRFADESLVWASKKYPDRDRLRELAARSYDRAYCPQGAARQIAALLANGPTVEGLRQLRLPTLVIHGLDDTLVTPSGGERTAFVVPGAHLLLIEHMGHDRPKPLWPRIVSEILQLTGSASN